MDEATQHIVPSNPRAIGRTTKRIRPRLWHLQVETSMGPGLVVVGGVGAEQPLQVAAAEHEHPVQALGPDRADPPLGEGVRPRARIGVSMIHTPSERNTSSKGPENFESRSRIRKQVPASRSPTTRLRACWVTHADSGLRVTPRTCTRRDPSSIANSTYRVRSASVSTVKKSNASIP
jgi:hypothetical protein